MRRLGLRFVLRVIGEGVLTLLLLLAVLALWYLLHELMSWG